MATDTINLETGQRAAAAVVVAVEPEQRPAPLAVERDEPVRLTDHAWSWIYTRAEMAMGPREVDDAIAATPKLTLKQRNAVLLYAAVAGGAEVIHGGYEIEWATDVADIINGTIEEPGAQSEYRKQVLAAFGELTRPWADEGKTVSKQTIGKTIRVALTKIRSARGGNYNIPTEEVI